MARRKDRSAFGALGGALKSKGGRRRRKDRLITASGFGRRKRGQAKGLAGSLAMGDRMFRRGSKSMVGQVGRSLRERLSPTEKAEIADESEKAVDQEQENTGQNDNAFIRFLRRVIRRERS